MNNDRKGQKVTGIMPSSNRDIVQELQEILRLWEEDQAVASKDPTPHLVKLCELFERETINFLKKDPDPFDDRHPVTSEPECALGQILRALFKKDNFVTKLVNHYLRENYFSSLGLTQDSTDLNTAACRLLLDLLYGLDIPQVFNESETTVMRLFSWSEKGPEPLRTYATGLLAAAMDIPEIAASFRDYNTHLVPIMLKRLWDLKDEGGGTEEERGSGCSVPERPFAHLNSESISALPLTNGEDADHKTDHESSPKKVKNSHQSTTPTKNTNTSGTFNIFGSPKASRDVGDPLLNSDCSNSSWAELSSYIVGTYQMYPMTRDTQQIFVLKYLRPIGEYQESLGHVYEHNALELIFHYMNVRKTGNARLSFEGLRFLGSLLFHKKFCLEFVNMGGIQKLLQVPRPSLPADGVALCLWYLAYCEEAVERICLLPDNILSELIRYALWLLECSHQSSRTHSVMFFGMVFRFRAVLERFDEQDGLRKVSNMVSTLSLFQDVWEQDSLDEPNEVMMWQTVKQVCLSIKHYFEAHLSLKVQHLQRMTAREHSSASQHSSPAYKAVNVTPEVIERNIEYLLENLPFRARWKPVEQFVSLKGLQLLLQLVAMVLNESFSPKMETAVFALDTLYVCSVMPAVQGALCDKLTIPASDDLLQTLDPQEVPGYAVLVACIHENTQSMTTSPEVQKAALNVLINCLCAPIYRPGSSVSRHSTSLTPNKKKMSSGEDVINKAWDCVRTSNGIMYLLNVLHKKMPITDADCIRGLSCRALVGLSRSDAARQIMSKLPIFTAGQLQLLMKEPILQDKRMEHVKFQRHALELIKAVSGRTKHEGDASTDISMQSIHRADVVAQTRISFNKKQLLQLIQTHLAQEGYEAVAMALQQAAHLPPLPPSVPHTSMGPPTRNMVTPPPSVRAHRLLSGSSSRHLFAATLCKGSSPANSGTLAGITSATTPSPSPPPVASPSTLANTSSPGPLHIKINRGSKRDSRGTALTNNSTLFNFSKSEMICNSCNCSQGNIGSIGNSAMSLPLVTNTALLSEPTISLDRIVTEYLINQHALCKNPVVTCPTFDLFQPHRCPEPKSLRAPPTNFTMRYARRSYNVPFTGLEGSCNNRKFIYSRYRPMQTYRSTDDDIFLCCEFTPDDQFIIVGTTRGEVRLFSKGGSEEGVYTVHQGAVSTLVPHSSGSLLLTSCTGVHETSLWSITDLFDEKFTLHECQHADFSNAQDKIIGTSEQTAKLYDLNTSQVVSEFTPKLSNHYNINKAVLDPTDDLILTDGVLFDVRTGKQIHKFDKINPILNGVFHRNGLEIISSSEIWDLRTFHLLRTVPVLNLCDIVFNHTNDVIFGITVGDQLDEFQENAFETSFKTVDAADYSSIATVDVRRVVSSLAINRNDTQIALVETENGTDDLTDDAVVRVYEVGMTRQDDDELPDDEDDDDDLGNEEDDSDSDDDPEQNSQDDNDEGSQEGDDDEDDNENDEEDGNSSITSQLSIFFEGENESEDSNSSDAVYFELNGDGNPADPSNASLSAWLQENDEEEEDAEDEDYEPSESPINPILKAVGVSVD
ncbi:DDB1- and CUL4-associated factor 1 isoform X3 [Procambarus clarkii]|uniref:DDB1- and CUL4-associated factor 1 isoform X3 n=1 Tax=Procambarus clarkii TaxID=6728 RepID=UPI001E675064|nr:DDB1- and CUL4-associated factor 1-like isoform X3 [Procambarus clarkii]